MANLLEVAESAWLQLFPNPTDETAVPKELFVVAAKTKLASKLWEQSKVEKAQEGLYNVPAYLLAEAQLEVKNNRVDTSELSILDSLSDEMWIQNIGGINCGCVYTKSNLNMAQLMCDDDALGTNARTYYAMGKEIVFPKGTHLKKIPIIYAKMPKDINDEIQVEDKLADEIGDYLLQRFGGKVGQQDTTNNSNSNK